MKDEESEEIWTMSLQWIGIAHEAEMRELRKVLEGRFENKDLAARHQVASERGWAAYEAYIQSEENEGELSIYIRWVQHTNEAEKAELRTEIFTGNMAEESLKIDVQDLKEDAQAEIDALKKERDEAEKKLERVTTSKTRINDAAKRYKSQNDQLHKDLEDWKQRTTEAMAVAEDLKGKLEKSQRKCDMLKAKVPYAQTVLSIMDKDHDIQQLRKANQGLETEKAQCLTSLRFNWEKLNEKEEELRKNRKELQLAANEVGFIHAQNMQYRSATENHPEKSAHIDGLLKRKDEAYSDLLKRYNECAEQRAEQEKGRDVDREHFAGVREELKQEIKYLESKVDDLEDGQSRYQKQNEKICGMFTRKIFKDDMIDAINAEHDLLKQDNASLVRSVRSKEVHVQEKIAEISPLKVRIIELEHTVESSAPKLRDLETEVNGLTTRNCELHVALQTMEGDLEGQIRDFRAELAQEKRRMEDFIRQGASATVQQTLDSKDEEIEKLRTLYAEARNNAWHWFNGVEELREDFDPVIWDNKIGNWPNELRERRLSIAEKMLTDLEKKLKEKGIWEEIRGDVDPRHRELDAAVESIDRL